MRPTIGRTVLYTRTAATERAPAQEFAALITRVEATDPISHPHRVNDENAYKVWLTVLIHTEQRTDAWFTSYPIRFHDIDGAAGADNTWRWPPRV